MHNPENYLDCVNAVISVGKKNSDLLAKTPCQFRNKDGQADVRYQALANINAWTVSVRMQLSSIVKVLIPGNRLNSDPHREARNRVFGEWTSSENDWQSAEEFNDKFLLFSWMTLTQFQLEHLLSSYAGGTPHSLFSYVAAALLPYHSGQKTQKDLWAPFGVLSGYRNSFHSNGLVTRNPASWQAPDGRVLETEVGKVAQNVDWISVGMLLEEILNNCGPLILDSGLSFTPDSVAAHASPGR